MCLSCKGKFTTNEYLTGTPITVIKNNGRREPYDRKKLQRGIAIACIKRPIPTEKIEQIVDKIEAEVQNTARREVESKTIGELVMKYLKDLDDVAYVRFASVYHKFQTKEEFLSELESLEEKNK